MRLDVGLELHYIILVKPLMIVRESLHVYSIPNSYNS
jgi:hypothetical protein